MVHITQTSHKKSRCGCLSQSKGMQAQHFPNGGEGEKRARAAWEKPPTNAVQRRTCSCGCPKSGALSVQTLVEHRSIGVCYAR